MNTRKRLYLFENLSKNSRDKAEADFFEDFDAFERIESEEIQDQLFNYITNYLSNENLNNMLDNIKIGFNASYSQGDGASFEYTVHKTNKYLKAAGLDKKERRRVNQALKDNKLFASRLSYHYYHAGTVKLDLDCIWYLDESIKNKLINYNEFLQRELDGELYPIIDHLIEYYKEDTFNWFIDNNPLFYRNGEQASDWEVEEHNDLLEQARALRYKKREVRELSKGLKINNIKTKLIKV